MPTNVDRRVTLGLFGNITDLKAKLGWVSAEKQKLEKDGIRVPVDADTKKAEISTDLLRKKFEALAAKRVSVKIDSNDTAAIASIANIEYRMTLLDRKTSKPKVGITGATKALADIAAIDLALDNLNKKNAKPMRNGFFFGFGPGGGSGGSSGGSSGGGGLGGVAGLLTNPYVLGGIAGIAPFAGQATGGTLIAGLGTALAGMGIAGAFGLGASATPAQIAAAQNKLKAAQLHELAVAQANAKKSTPASQASLLTAQNNVGAAQTNLTVLQNDALSPGQMQVRKVFKNLADDAQGSLSQIGKSFIPVMQSVLNTADSTLQKLTPVFSGAVKIISGPFQMITNTFIKSWEQPAIAQSINAVAKAFVAIMVALAPSIPGMMRQIADAITAIANNIAKNPKAFADFIRFLTDIIVGALDAVNGLTVAANWIENHFIPAVKAIGIAFLGLGIEILPVIKALVDGVLSAFGTILHGAADAFGWIPGIGGKIRAASKSFDEFKAGVDSNFNSMINQMKAWQNNLIGTTKVSQSSAAQIVGHFSNQAKSAKVALGQVDNYSTAIRQNGVISNAAGNARVKLIKDMIGSGVNAVTANRDVTSYTAAVAKNGVNSDQARAARQRLISDIESAFKNSQRGQSDMQNYSRAVLVNGSNSDAARAARARLIQDLEHAGLNAQQAKNLVNQLQTSINNLRGKTISVIMTGQGTFKVTEVGGTFGFSNTNAKTGQVTAFPVKAAASGLYINSGAPGVDDQLILAQRHELVVPPGIVKSGAVDHLRGMIPGFAGGGVVGNLGPGSVPGMWNNYHSVAVGTMVETIKGAVKAAMAAVGPFLGAGSGNYAADIQAVLRGFGLPLSLTANWLRQIQTESGGSLGAVNRTDSNAIAGHPSVGLLQLIPGTFAAYAGPYRNTGPLVNMGGGFVSENPMAQIYAAINYARHVYPNMAGVIGQGHGYDSGGILPPGATLAINRTGHNEYVVNPANGGLGATYIINIYPTPLAHPRDIGREVVGAIKEFEKGSGSGWRK